MVKWVCLVSPTLSNRKASYFAYLFCQTQSICRSLTHCDLYFRVHWFWLISLVLSNRVSYFGYLFSFTLWVTSCFVGHCDLYFIAQWLCFVSHSDSIKCEGIILWILVQSDTVNDLLLFAITSHTPMCRMHFTYCSTVFKKLTWTPLMCMRWNRKYNALFDRMMST